MSINWDAVTAAEQAAIEASRACPTCRWGRIGNDDIQCQSCLAEGARLDPNQKYEEHQ
jgi:hypothetical protein